MAEGLPIRDGITEGGLIVIGILASERVSSGDRLGRNASMDDSPRRTTPC